MSFGANDRSDEFTNSGPQIDFDRATTGYNIETNTLRRISIVNSQCHQLGTSNWKRGDGRKFVNRYANRNILYKIELQTLVIYYLLTSSESNAYFNKILFA